MRSYSTGISVFVLAVCAALPADAAQRAFVASYGSDVAACTIASPCRSFSAAIVAVDNGGEVVVLDSAGYGPVTIAKSVGLVAPAGVHAAVTIPAAGNGISISSGNFDVTIRGLTLIGSSGSDYGIRAQHDGTLTLERIWIEGASNSISITPSASVKVDLRHIVMKRGSTGIFATDAYGNFTNVVADDFSSTAIAVSNGSKVTISQAIVTNATGNGYAAISASASGGGVTWLMVADSRLTNVFVGISASDFGGTVYVEATANTVIGASAAGLSAQSPGATLIASRNSVTRSNIGLQASLGGTLVTFNDNAVTRNTGSDTSGTMTGASYK